jgi:uncharacterized protein (DUF2062 family)
VIFKRRKTLGPLGRVRAALQPRKSWRRGFTYVGRRVQRLPDTPHRIALGFACGAMASFTPLFTLHILVAVAAAALVRGNLIAAALGTAIGNPITFPVIAGVSLSLGAWITGAGEKVSGFNIASVFTDLGAFLDVVFVPYLLGGALPGLIASVACYCLMRPVVAVYQNRRRNKLMKAAKARVHAGLAGHRLKANPAPDLGE